MDATALLAKLAGIPGLGKVLTKLFGYERGQALRRISHPIHANEEIGLGFFDVWGNIGIDLLEGWEDNMNGTVPTRKTLDGCINPRNWVFDEQLNLFYYDNRIISRFAHRYAVASASRAKTRLELASKTIGELKPEFPIDQKEFPQPEAFGYDKKGDN